MDRAPGASDTLRSPTHRSKSAKIHSKKLRKTTDRDSAAHNFGLTSTDLSSYTADEIDVISDKIKPAWNATNCRQYFNYLKERVDIIYNFHGNEKSFWAISRGRIGYIPHSSFDENNNVTTIHKTGCWLCGYHFPFYHSTGTRHSRYGIIFNDTSNKMLDHFKFPPSRQDATLYLRFRNERNYKRFTCTKYSNYLSCRPSTIVEILHDQDDYEELPAKSKSLTWIFTPPPPEHTQNVSRGPPYFAGQRPGNRQSEQKK
jgi:hypothetical protein